MTKKLDDIITKLPKNRQDKIEKRTEQLIIEYQILKDIQKARNLTREYLVKSLGIEQENIEKLEEETDLLLSTLRNYIREMGGNLQLIAKFPDRPPIELTGFTDRENSAN